MRHALRIAQNPLPMVLVAAAALTLALGAGLRQDAFFSGDAGVKLIAAQNAAAHPQRPFEIDVPVIDGAVFPFVDRFMQLHGDHMHALQSDLFPVLASPLIAWMGVRGAYIIPAISFLALIVVVERLRVRAAPDAPAGAVAMTALLATPLFFYAFEFWEHVPAALVCGIAMLLAWRGTQMASIGAGLLFGLAMLLRPEALVLAAAVMVFAPVSLRLRALMAAGLMVVAGAGALINYAHFGRVVGPHASANLAGWTAGWWTSHLARGVLWFAPHSAVEWIGAAAIAASWGIRRHAGERTAQLLGLAGVILIGVAAALRMMPRESLWQAWPAGALVFVPHRSAGAAQLRALGFTTAAAILLASTHDGGAQWGPRFLFVAAPIMILLTGAAAGDMARRSGPWPRLRALLVAVVFLASAAVSRAAYRELDSAKENYGTIVDLVRATAAPGEIVVSDVWWFAQITAADYRRHTTLVSDGPEEPERIAAALEAHRIQGFVLAESREQGPPRARALGCYEPLHSTAVPVRGIVLTRYGAATCAAAR